MGITTTWGIVLKSHNIRKVKNHCTRQVVVTHTFYTSTWEEEAGGYLWVQGQPGLQELDIVPGQVEMLHRETQSRKKQNKTKQTKKQNKMISVRTCVSQNTRTHITLSASLGRMCTSKILDRWVQIQLWSTFINISSQPNFRDWMRNCFANFI